MYKQICHQIGVLYKVGHVFNSICYSVGARKYDETKTQVTTYGRSKNNIKNTNTPKSRPLNPSANKSNAERR